MKKEITTRKEENRWINVHDDNVMREMGLIRPYVLEPRDKSVWQRTHNERRILRNVKHMNKKEDMHFHTVPQKQATIYTKLIVYLKNNKTFPKSTYSQMCLDTHVSDILEKFSTTNGKSLVIKYFYNGKTYEPNK